MQTINVLTKQNTFVVRNTRTTINILAKQKRGLPGKDGNALGYDKNYVYDFAMQHTLNINHGLQKYPTATVINSAGDKVESMVKYVDVNNVTIEFTAPFSGRVTLN